MIEIVEEMVEIPENMDFEIHGKKLCIKLGDKENCYVFQSANIMLVPKEKAILIRGKPNKRSVRALVKTFRAHINNLITGLEKGFKYRLSAVYSHFPMNIAVKDNVVEINNFTGEKRPRIAKIIEGVKVEVKGKEITVTGHNKEAVSQTAANLEQATRIKNKDTRVFQDGIYLVEKGFLQDKVNQSE